MPGIARYTEEEFAALIKKRGHGVTGSTTGFEPVGSSSTLDGPAKLGSERGPVVTAPQASVTATPTNKVLDTVRSPYRSRLEKDYAGYLHTMMLAGEIRSYKYEAIRLRLAEGTTLTVDWFIVTHTGDVELHETKARWFREDGWVKLKVAASLFPMWKFFLVQRKRGTWNLKELPV